MDHLGSTVIISITVINKHPIMAIITIVEAIIYWSSIIAGYLSSMAVRLCHILGFQSVCQSLLVSIRCFRLDCSTSWSIDCWILCLHLNPIDPTLYLLHQYNITTYLSINIYVQYITLLVNSLLQFVELWLIIILEISEIIEIFKIIELILIFLRHLELFKHTFLLFDELRIILININIIILLYDLVGFLLLHLRNPLYLFKLFHHGLLLLQKVLVLRKLINIDIIVLFLYALSRFLLLLVLLLLTVSNLLHVL